ncbi:9522_t:CDS:2 [Diversispora eburnea]|uniref:9522_t:CDS:1 n=1 Tax=Diversispora eburnea TaxID=1213867 RepID=A0A9N9GBS2_9GLOM|nr:9522_t:CDS:2 [Diversispora eburnea]
MIIDPNFSTIYDGRRLKSINLTEEEWQAIGELIIILEDFAEATEYLGGSKYTTISLMYSILEIISQKLLPDGSEVEIVDLSNSNTAFDDNISYNDATEEDDEPITGEPKSRKIIPQEHGMLAALLDSRFKDLELASEEICIKTLEQFKKAYQDTKILANDNQEIECILVKSNSFLARMFQNNNDLEENV